MRTIRRSNARDLPPSADAPASAVIVKSARDRAPVPGERLQILAPCGVELTVRVTSVEPDDTGWIGWGDVMPGGEAQLRAAGVPLSDAAPMRIFSHQVVR
jgi:hypothetical protein